MTSFGGPGDNPLSPSLPDHAWVPKSACDASCVAAGSGKIAHSWVIALRMWLRVTLVAVALLLAIALAPVLAVPVPGRAHLYRRYFRFALFCLGVRVRVSGGPIRNLQGVLVAAGHVSWLDVLVIGSVLQGSFVARADMVHWPVLGGLARAARTIPIDRANLRQLPEVVDTISDRLAAGETVVAFPEATTWCGLASGTFRPAVFQAALDAARPVQPLRMTYRHPDGAQSTVPAFVGDDTLLESVKRVITARRTIAHVHVPSLQLPAGDRRDMARRCEAAVRETSAKDARVTLARHELVA